MGALTDQFLAAGVTFTALDDGRLHADGTLTDEIRAAIRAEKQTILAELAANGATPEQAAELRPVIHAERHGVQHAEERHGLRTCRECANLTPAGRCIAAARGESFGAGIAVSRDYAPDRVDRAQRCGVYLPGPGDTDRRPGRERWAFLFVPSVEDAARSCRESERRPSTRRARE